MVGLNEDLFKDGDGDDGVVEIEDEDEFLKKRFVGDITCDSKLAKGFVVEFIELVELNLFNLKEYIEFPGELDESIEFIELYESLLRFICENCSFVLLIKSTSLSKVVSSSSSSLIIEFIMTLLVLFFESYESGNTKLFLIMAFYEIICYD
ncbi:hypothetical protein WICMUC_001359 [Wickerhamomyces mucosus]|uniref:Uncharacterized protein n=1 Tax=Wickerhamomyces mucosus TaxID=1378264 RepID=A0A9P8PVU2_9ASCO|nr:hypothetical protein WICMUC_001359 [Wickerhamomyces mucosus]